MISVELVLTETRLWARGDTTYWHGPPSLVPASDGTSFVAGEALRAPSPAVSVVALADADRIAFPTMPTTTDAFAVVVEAVLTDLRLPAPCDRLTVLAPSGWGRRRAAVVHAAATRMVSEVTVEPLAVRAASLGDSTAQHQRIAVLELDPLSTTVTLVGRSGSQTWIDACEHEPAVGLADADDERGLDAIAAVVGRLLAGQTPNYLLTVGISDTALLDALRSAITARCGFPADVRPVAGADLLRGSRPPDAAPRPAREHPLPDRDISLHRAAMAARPTRRRTPLVIAGAVATVVAIALAAGVAMLLNRPSHDTTTEAAGPRPSAAVAAPAPGSQTFGRVRTAIPSGWHVAAQSDTRADLMPDDGARQRITLVQKSLTPGVDTDDVARTLTDQLQRRPAGTVTELRRDQNVGGRPGLSYEEYPPDDTIVRWQLRVDSALQVSVGCQYATDEGGDIAAPCAQVVDDLTVTPP